MSDTEARAEIRVTEKKKKKKKKKIFSVQLAERTWMPGIDRSRGERGRQGGNLVR